MLLLLLLLLLLLQSRNLAKERLPYAPAAATPAASQQQQTPAANDTSNNRAQGPTAAGTTAAGTTAAAPTVAGQQGTPGQAELADIQLLPRMADKFVSDRCCAQFRAHQYLTCRHSFAGRHRNTLASLNECAHIHQNLC
jgi:hypothetical protein